jgi:hypothetical protein
MTEEQKFLNETYEKQKPKLLFPIFNTILGFGLAGILVYLTIIQDLKVWVMLLAILLIILFIASSWYNSYFSKRKMRKEIYNLQEETEILIDAVRLQKKKHIYEINDPKKLKFRFEKDNNLELEKISFNLKKREFSKDIEGYTKIDFCVACAGLLVEPKTKEVIGFGGMAPCSVWLKKKLKTPIPVKGRIYVDAPGYQMTDKTIFKYLRHEDTFYDRKTGWLCFGPKKIEVIDDVIEIMENVYVVLRDEELISVWVNVGIELEIA